MVTSSVGSALKQPKGRKQAESVIRVRSLSKKYRDGKEAVRELSLFVREGDIFGLVGPDGAGKTTTLKILAGVMEATSGEALIFGLRPRDARHLIGFVPQNTALYEDLTVEENLRYDAGLRNVSEADFGKRREKFLKKMGLLRYADRLAGQLSGGMKQKLALCCALIAQPQLLLLDEPTIGLDPVSRQEFWQILGSVAQEGVTTIIATPFLDEAERCTRVALIYDGHVRDTGTPGNLRDKLGLSRLEVHVPEAWKIEEAITSAIAQESSNIVEIYSMGDQLDLLVKNPEIAEREIRDLLASKKLAPQMVRRGKPTLEHVFVDTLRKAGLTIEVPPPMPRLLLQRQALDESAIAACGVTRSYGPFKAVDQVDLDVAYGEIHGLLGANGAGKTSLIKMLCGLLPPTSGSITLGGEKQDLRKVRNRIGYMSQKFTLYDNLTVAENLEFYATIYEIPWNKRKEKISWVLEACGLKNLENILIKRLPRGWKQRIAFGASVMHEPEILFLDEPTAGVDPIARRQLWLMIKDFARHGAAILITTHYMDEAEHAHKLSLMAEGTIIANGSPSEIKQQPQGKLYKLSTDDPQNAFQVLRERFTLGHVTIFGDSVHILVDNSELELQKIKSTLKDAHVAIQSFKQIPFSLEDAFVALIQTRALRPAGNHEK